MPSRPRETDTNSCACNGGKLQIGFVSRHSVEALEGAATQAAPIVERVAKKARLAESEIVPIANGNGVEAIVGMHPVERIRGSRCACTLSTYERLPVISPASLISVTAGVTIICS